LKCGAAAVQELELAAVKWAAAQEAAAMLLKV
jgi:hypothetical protein